MVTMIRWTAIDGIAGPPKKQLRFVQISKRGCGLPREPKYAPAMLNLLTFE